MQQIFSAMSQAFGKRILIFALMSLLSLSGLFTFSGLPALADQSLSRPSQEAIDRAYTYSEATGFKEEDRQAAYEKATEVINEPQGLEKVYEEDLKSFKKENPDENGLIEGAKDLVNKVTGKE